jgi:hypothetical protein
VFIKKLKVFMYLSVVYVISPFKPPPKSNSIEPTSKAAFDIMQKFYRTPSRKLITYWTSLKFDIRLSKPGASFFYNKFTTLICEPSPHLRATFEAWRTQ